MCPHLFALIALVTCLEINLLMIPCFAEAAAVHTNERQELNSTGNAHRHDALARREHSEREQRLTTHVYRNTIAEVGNSAKIQNYGAYELSYVLDASVDQWFSVYFGVLLITFLCGFCCKSELGLEEIEGRHTWYLWQAWLVSFICTLEIMIRFLPACCSTDQARKYNNAKFLLKLCYQGLTPWSAITFYLLGIDSVTIQAALDLSNFQAPSKEADKTHPMEVFRNDDMTRIFGYNFVHGNGDYDIWRSQFVRRLARTTFRFFNWWYPPAYASVGDRHIVQEEEDFILNMLLEFGANIKGRNKMYLPDTALGIKIFVTIGYGAPFLKQEGEGFVVDMSALETFVVRSGFCRYGGKLFFDKNMEFQHLIYLGRQYVIDDSEFRAAMYILRTSCVVVGVWIYHVCHCHFLSGGFTATASRTALHADHALRRITHLYSLGTIPVNSPGALELISGRGGSLWRQSGFTQKASDDVLALALNPDCMWAYRFEHFETELKRRGVFDLPKEIYPYGHFGLKLYNIHDSFAKAYVDHYWPTDETVRSDMHLQNYFKEYSGLFPPGYIHGPPNQASRKSDVYLLLCVIMWNVTAVHEKSGRTVELWSARAALSCCEGSDTLLYWKDLLPRVSLRISLFLTQCLAHRPGVKLMRDASEFMHLLREDCPIEIVSKYMSDLNALHDEIQEFNKTLGYGEEGMAMIDPKNLEAAVTV